MHLLCCYLNDSLQFLTSLARATLGLFKCTTLEADDDAMLEGRQGLDGQGLGSTKLWTYSMQYECLGPEHKRWALGPGILLLLLIYVLLPLSLACMLYAYRKALNDSWVQRHFWILVRPLQSRLSHVGGGGYSAYDVIGHGELLGRV